MIFKCPGQDSRNVVVENIKCRGCGYELEFFSDEIKITCPGCKNTIYRDKLPSCIDWCRYAEECVGRKKYGEHTRAKSVILKEKIIREMENYFGSDAKRINHAKKVLKFAEELLRREEGDWHIVLPASMLHDVGIKAAEQKYGLASGRYQEQEGPAIARKILFGIGMKNEHIDEIARIIAYHHTPGVINTQNFKILYDADWLVNLKDEVDTDDTVKLKEIIGRVFLTEAGRELAGRIYLKKEENNVL